MKKPSIQIDREIITKIPNTTEAVILSYIIYEQASSFKNNKKLRKITGTEIASKFGISKATVSRNIKKLYEKNLLVEDSPIPNPIIEKLLLNENDKSFDIDFIKVDKEWFLNPDIDIATKYWIIFFKAFEKSDNWTPTWAGIERCSCWKEEGIRKSYYKLRDEGWVHNDKTIDVNIDYQRIQGKSYNIDFVQTKAEKTLEEQIVKTTSKRSS